MSHLLPKTLLTQIGSFSVFTIVSITIFLAAIFLFKKFTSYDEIEEIKKNNRAVAIVYSGAILSVSIIIASLVRAEAGMIELLIWSSVGLVAQIILFSAVKLIFPKYIERIKNGEDAIAIIMFSLAIAIALINAACISTP
ncbi:DUF350 domain-containing protein [Photobacterium kishitanii]|uniref:DUF350 domain-containing protein n=1 Tax=Photobacterium kishitanii TaxID=318456 RepID=A0A2T3KM71_9GAMM|nr:DUF350 domain-containing protein [Photobacterium kishitanii]PSV00896.1 hypothetical protein C9J27_02395 [Photobacterium kishitanii]